MWLCVIATFSIFVVYSDIKYRKIANTTCLLLSFFCGVYAFIYSEIQILIPIVILLSGIVLSVLRILGGGDTKLLAAYSLAIDPDLFSSVLIIIGISGGLLSLIYLLIYKNVKNNQASLPYAIPIAIGGSIGILASM